jgi:hypothetical protein
MSETEVPVSSKSEATDASVSTQTEAPDTPVSTHTDSPETQVPPKLEDDQNKDETAELLARLEEANK